MTAHSPLRADLVVLLCSHNGAAHLPALLQSLAAQSLPPARLIAHDWGSTDETLAILQRFSQSQSETAGSMPVEIIQHPDAPGASSSFRQALAMLVSNGLPFDHVLLCDQDDLWHAEKTERVAQAAKTGADFIWSDVRLIDAAGSRLSPSFYDSHSAFVRPRHIAHASFLLVNPVVGMSLSVSRRLLELAAPSLHLPWLMHDWCLGITAVGHRLQTQFIDQALADYRQHGANLLGAATGLRLRQRLIKARSHFLRLDAQLPLAAKAGGPAWQALAPSLVACGDGGSGRPSRWAVASAAARSPLLRWHSRWFLAFAVCLFWPGRRD